jgi:hypothetical protein
MPARQFAVLIGSVFVIFGVLGFIPGFVVHPVPYPGAPHTIAANAGYGALFRFFPVNYVRDIVQLAIGLAGWAAATGSMRRALVWCRLVFLYCAAMMLLGILPWTRTLFGLMPIFGWNVWFHFVFMLVTFYMSFIYPMDRLQPERTR